MGFLDDLKKALDDAFQVPRGPIIGEDQVLNRDGISPMSGSDLNAPSDSPHSLNLADAISIQQQRSTGFNVVTIIPSVMDALNYGCTLSMQQILNLVGAEFDSVSVSTPPRNPWRSITIPVMGNFLKITSPVAKQYTVTIPGTGSQGLPDYNEDHVPANDGIALGASALNGGSNPVLLIQFGDSTAPAMVANYGDSFELAFSSVILSFKVGAPKITLVIGYNSKMSSETNRGEGIRLSTATNREIWNSPMRHPVPWCVSTTRSTLAGSFPVGAQDVNYQGWHPLTLNTYYTLPVFWQYKTTDVIGTDVTNTHIGFDKGVGIGWITSLNAVVIFYSAALAYYSARVSVAIVSAAGTIRKILINIPVSAGSGTAFYGTVNILQSFPEAIRFELLPGERLNMYFHAFSNITTVIQGGLTGYTYGNIYGPVMTTGPDGTINTPMALYPVLDNPYPLDTVPVTSSGP